MTTQFSEIRKACDQYKRVTGPLLDEFLVYYAADRDNLDREFDIRMASYKHLIETDQHLPWVRMLKSQYIIHRVFKSGGLLRSYLNHAVIKQRSPEEQQFLQEQLAVPWRFCFSVISDSPERDFYQMVDVLTGEPFLLYSGSVSQILTEQPAVLWFNLISFNGSCWQTFGPLNAYQSFTLDDIFFFATEVNPQIDSEESLALDIEKNPLPYMMLLNGGTMPAAVNNGEELFIILSEEELASVDNEKLRATFKVEYHKNVYRLSISEFADFPHLAVAYIDEKRKQLLVTAMTERGFKGIVKALGKSDIFIDEDPQIRVHPGMLATAEAILKRKIVLNPYDKLFTVKSSPQARRDVDKMNQFLQSVLPAINSGKEIDIERFAREAGVDEQLAKMIVQDAIARLRS